MAAAEIEDNPAMDPDVIFGGIEVEEGNSDDPKDIDSVADTKK